jgi:hypothetical protein
MDEIDISLEILENIKDGDFSKVDNDILKKLYDYILSKQTKSSFNEKCIENEKIFLDLLENTEQFSVYGKLLHENLNDAKNIISTSDFNFIEKLSLIPNYGSNKVKYTSASENNSTTSDDSDDSDDFYGRSIGEVEIKIKEAELQDIYLEDDILDFIIKDLYKNRDTSLDTPYEVKSFMDILTIPAGLDIVSDKMFNKTLRASVGTIILSADLRGLNADILCTNHIFAKKGVLPEKSILCLGHNDHLKLLALDVLAPKVLVNNPNGKNYSKQLKSMFAYKLFYPEGIGLLKLEN